MAWRGLGGEVVGGRSKPRPYGSKRERTLILVETGRGPLNVAGRGLRSGMASEKITAKGLRSEDLSYVSADLIERLPYSGLGAFL